jgi:hypothetical protein
MKHTSHKLLFTLLIILLLTSVAYIINTPDQNLLIKTGSLSIDSSFLDSDSCFLIEGESSPDITVPTEDSMSGDDLTSEQISLTSKVPFAFGILVSDYSDAFLIYTRIIS